MAKRLMTLEDLYLYYSSNTKSSHFSAKNEGDTIVVQVNGLVNFEETDSDTEGLCPVTLRACHDLDNVNGSFISKENLEAALPSFSNRPILGYIHSVNGQDEFYDHRMHLDDDGEIVYDEKPIGIIPESANAHLEYNEKLGKDQVVVNGYIFEEYSTAADIIRRDGECSVSVELSIRELSYDAKEKRLNIENFYFSGVTALGKTPEGKEVKPGMVGSNMKLADFKLKNSESCFSESNVLDMLEKISDKLDMISAYSINENSTKGGNKMLESLLEKYNKAIEEIEFEYEGLSDEELEAAFSQAFDKAEDEGDDPSSEENTNESEGKSDDTTEDGCEECKFSKTFELSHDDIKCGLYGLLEVVEASDNDWYCITNVYDDHFVYEGIFTNAIYGQRYIKDGDNLSFEGERYALHKELLTDSEYAQLNDMRSNYAEISDKLQKYEEEPQKMEILNSQKYGYVAETEEFAGLVADHFDLSIDDVTAKANEILLSYADKGALKFSVADEENKVANKKLPVVNKKSSRYGNLFSK